VAEGEERSSNVPPFGRGWRIAPQRISVPTSAIELSNLFAPFKGLPRVGGLAQDGLTNPNHQALRLNAELAENRV
jgi:hypothetical protein